MKKFQVEARVYTKPGTYKGKPCPIYRTTCEYFTNYEKARKRYDRLIELHSPDWRISIGQVYGGMFNSILDDNWIAHIVWLFDTHGISAPGYNVENARKVCLVSEEPHNHAYTFSHSLP